MKLNVLAFGLTCALVWGLGLLAITWWIIVFEGQTGEETALGLVYRGFNISAVGSIIGLAWGFADGLVGGVVFAGIAAAAL